MRETIIRALDEIESIERVRVLFAAEWGSRAFGFDSPSSDYDVRFVYMRRMEDYLALERPRDVIEPGVHGKLDMEGWDVTKALTLIKKSNPAVREWANSPVVYRVTPRWRLIEPHIERGFSMKAAMYHYINMARQNYKPYLKGENVRVKKYLYVMRPLLAAKWVLDHGAPPPMLFDELMAATLDRALRPVMEELLKQKRSGREMGMAPRIDALNDYIDRGISELESAARDMPRAPDPNGSELDALFFKLVTSGD